MRQTSWVAVVVIEFSFSLFASCMAPGGTFRPTSADCVVGGREHGSPGLGFLNRYDRFLYRFCTWLFHAFGSSQLEGEFGAEAPCASRSGASEFEFLAARNRCALFARIQRTIPAYCKLTQRTMTRAFQLFSCCDMFNTRMKCESSHLASLQ